MPTSLLSSRVMKIPTATSSSHPGSALRADRRQGWVGWFLEKFLGEVQQVKFINAHLLPESCRYLSNIVTFNCFSLNPWIPVGPQKEKHWDPKRALPYTQPIWNHIKNCISTCLRTASLLYAADLIYLRNLLKGESLGNKGQIHLFQFMTKHLVAFIQILLLFQCTKIYQFDYFPCANYTIQSCFLNGSNRKSQSA